MIACSERTQKPLVRNSPDTHPSCRAICSNANRIAMLSAPNRKHFWVTNQIFENQGLTVRCNTALTSRSSRTILPNFSEECRNTANPPYTGLYRTRQGCVLVRDSNPPG